jgi:hypothetical protein
LHLHLPARATPKLWRGEKTGEPEAVLTFFKKELFWDKNPDFMEKGCKDETCMVED